MQRVFTLRWVWLLAGGFSLSGAGCKPCSEHGSKAPSVASSELASHPRAELSPDPELAAAQRAAIGNLSEFRRLLTSADPGVQDPQVQAMVREGPLTEAVWLLDVRAVPGGFEGAVNAQPRVLKALQRGQQIQVADQDVLDLLCAEESATRCGPAATRGRVRCHLAGQGANGDQGTGLNAIHRM